MPRRRPGPRKQEDFYGQIDIQESRVVAVVDIAPVRGSAWPGGCVVGFTIMTPGSIAIAAAGIPQTAVMRAARTQTKTRRVMEVPHRDSSFLLSHRSRNPWRWRHNSKQTQLPGSRSSYRRAPSAIRGSLHLVPSDHPGRSLDDRRRRQHVPALRRELNKALSSAIASAQGGGGDNPSGGVASVTHLAISLS